MLMIFKPHIGYGLHCWICHIHPPTLLAPQLLAWGGRPPAAAPWPVAFAVGQQKPKWLRKFWGFIWFYDVFMLFNMFGQFSEILTKLLVTCS